MAMREIHAKNIVAEQPSGRPKNLTSQNEEGGWSAGDDLSSDEDVVMKDATVLS
jgi:hypothetical protein